MKFVRIKEFPNYGVSRDGRVANLKTGKMRKLETKKDGYVRVNLSKDGAVSKKYIHRLVYEAWVCEIPSNMQVDHIDEDKGNNHADNLQLLFSKDNTCKSVKQKSCPTLVRGEEELVVTRPLTDFSKKHGFHNPTLNKVLTGHYFHHQGWRLK